MSLLATLAPTYRAISPAREMGAYEALWLEHGASFKRIAERLRAEGALLPSELVSEGAAREALAGAEKILRAQGIDRFGVRVHGAGDYPERLRDAKEPVALLYFRGSWELAQTRGISIVGTRHPSEEGARRASRAARALVDAGFTIVSGLAAGIDAAAHKGALAAGGRTIAVVGTPLGQVYPPEHKALQEEIAREHLLISQVPILRYARQDWRTNRFFFPERNKTMSALTEGSLIIEAGETSGTLTQARAALDQGRKLFLLNSLFENTSLTWPAKYEARGAIRVKGIDDILEHVAPPHQD